METDTFDEAEEEENEHSQHSEVLEPIDQQADDQQASGLQYVEPQPDDMIKISQGDYDLALGFKEARERLGVPPGFVGALMGLFRTVEFDDIQLEKNRLVVIYHDKKLGKRALKFVRDFIREELQINVVILGNEMRPKIGAGRKHPWYKRTFFRTLLRNSGKIEDDE